MPNSLVIDSVFETRARAQATIFCAHCRTPMDGGDGPGPNFCCRGCETVFHMLQENGLSDYYRLRGEPDGAPLIPKISPENFDFLDDPKTMAAYTVGDRRVQFYLEGVHCAACIWLVEKLPSLEPGVAKATLDLGQGIATVDLVEGGSFAAAARALNGLGYPPHAIKPGETHSFERKENRKSVIRIGIAGASAMNIMTMSMALYGGVEGVWAANFRWASFAFYLPVVFYCAVPFYTSALASVKVKRLSIDIPIVVGIVGGTLAGMYNLFAAGHGNEIYFDSLSVLVFLLLTSRYLIRRSRQKALASVNFVRQLMPLSTRRWSETEFRFESVAVEFLAKGDRIEVRAGEVIPADGQIEKGTTELSYAALTGEFHPRQAGPGDPVFSGCVNNQAPVEIRVQVAGIESRLGKLADAVREAAARKAPATEWADRISGWFIATVITLGTAVFLFWYWRAGFQPAFNNAMALFIVTCPCALAMSAPVATLVSMSRLARRGTVLKGADVIEHVSRADTVFLDKTGTLTEGRLRVIAWNFAAHTDGADEVRQAVYELERKSNHPIGIALADELERCGIRHRFEVEGLREEIGKGISGRVAGRHYEIVRSAALAPDMSDIGDGEVKTAISIRRDERIVAEVTLGDRLREDSKEAVAWLAGHGVTPHLLSGDVAAPVLQTAAALSIPGERARSGCSPEDKLAMVQDRPRTLMVGDGANDSAALAAATVGIAVHGGMEISLSVADVYLQKPGLQPIVLLIRGARETMAVIRRNLAFSLLYNLVGATAAAMGLMSPLFAAVLMPISSVTILSLSLWGAKSLR